MKESLVSRLLPLPLELFDVAYKLQCNPWSDPALDYYLNNYLWVL